ncbi:hypothetical protein GW17_00017536 [Ensete ventricosum]|nr:hypothetical protein GW17_00017536 [Ensete ventricosum]
MLILEWWKSMSVPLRLLIHLIVFHSKHYNFDLYRPYWAVCTGPSSYRYADCPLSGDTAKINCRRSIEGEKGKKKKKKRKRRKKKRGRRRSTSRRPCPCAAATLARG